MKIYLVLIPLFTLVSFSQEKESYKNVATKFQEYYNATNYKEIYNLFSEKTQKVLTLKRTTDFLKNKVSPLGKILSQEFYKVEGNAHIYKSTFKNGLIAFTLILNNERKIIGYKLVPFKFKEIKRNTTQMILPFKEEWTVGWGGISIENNYHVAYKNQKYAYDLFITKKGVTHKKTGKNECYYVFGKDLLAVCDAKVVKVINGVYDNIPQEKNPKQVTGNTIVLETKNNEYILYAHLKENSILVKEGQFVKQGEIIGKCGNSGNSTEPHLHLSLQNTIAMQNAIGGKLFFNNIIVNGQLKEDYIPVKNDKIKNN